MGLWTLQKAVRKNYTKSYCHSHLSECLSQSHSLPVSPIRWSHSEYLAPGSQSYICHRLYKWIVSSNWPSWWGDTCCSSLGSCHTSCCTACHLRTHTRSMVGCRGVCSPSVCSFHPSLHIWRTHSLFHLLCSTREHWIPIQHVLEFVKSLWEFHRKTDCRLALRWAIYLARVRVLPWSEQRQAQTVHLKCWLVCQQSPPYQWSSWSLHPASAGLQRWTYLDPTLPEDDPSRYCHGTNLETPF